jgi:hypothetical protein
MILLAKLRLWELLSAEGLGKDTKLHGGSNALIRAMVPFEMELYGTFALVSRFFRYGPLWKKI